MELRINSNINKPGLSYYETAVYEGNIAAYICLMKTTIKDKTYYEEHRSAHHIKPGVRLGKRQAARARELHREYLPQFERALRNAGWTQVELVRWGDKYLYWVAPEAN